MADKILVAYATRCGSTVEVAQAVAKTLTARGFSTDVRLVKQVASVTDYHAVVIGSAIRFGQWLPEAVQFVAQNSAALTRLSCAFFAVHVLNQGDDEASRNARLAYLDPVRKLVPSAEEAFFAGALDIKKVNFLERVIARMVKSPEGDFRDWQKIDAWSKTIFA